MTGTDFLPEERLWLAERRISNALAWDLHLTVEEGPGAEPGFQLPPGLPALISCRDGRVIVKGDLYSAVIEPDARTARLVRREGGNAPLQVAMKVALSALLPLTGGLFLHSAGIMAPRGAVLFFGPSGAGKSTLASLSPFPVLSDELITVHGPAPHRAGATGFWGTLAARNGPDMEAPLVALVELDKADSYSIQRLGTQHALRRLLGVALMPPDPSIWKPALSVLGAVVADVPVFRMSWSLLDPPWEYLRAQGLYG